MPLMITKTEFTTCTGLTPAYAARILSKTKRIGKDLYPVAEILATMTPFEKYARKIVTASYDDNELIVTNDETLIEGFQSKIMDVPEMSRRAHRCQSEFTLSLVASRNSAGFMIFLNSLRSKWLLHGPTTRYVVTGEGEPDTSKNLASAFALVNAVFVESMSRLELREFRDLTRMAA